MSTKFSRFFAWVWVILSLAAAWDMGHRALNADGIRAIAWFVAAIFVAQVGYAVFKAEIKGAAEKGYQP